MLQDVTEEELNMMLLKLTYACPTNQKNLNCPLKEMRKKEFNERSNWINWLSFTEKQYIFQHHEICLSRQ